MKRYLGRILAVALTTATLATGACALEDEDVGLNDDELGGLLFGDPVLIDFDLGSLTVSRIDVLVANGWLNSENFSVEVDLYGFVGGNEAGLPCGSPDPESDSGTPRPDLADPCVLDRGHKEVTLTKDLIFPDTAERGTVIVSIDWSNLAVSYTPTEAFGACVQIKANGNPLGEVMCSGSLTTPE